MRQNQYGEWEVVPPGDPEYDRDRFGWHLDPLEIDELVLREKRDLMAEHQYANIELKATMPDGEVRVTKGYGAITTTNEPIIAYRWNEVSPAYPAGYDVVTEIEWWTKDGKTIDIEVTPAPLKEPTTPGARIELSNGSKWIRTHAERESWVCYYSIHRNTGVATCQDWYGLSHLSPKLVTD